MCKEICFLKKFITVPFLLSLVVMTNANASLVREDLTLDTSTGLEWLNLTQTVGQTYNAIVSGYGGFTTSLGFRFANGNELAQLRTDAGITGLRSTTGDVSNINNTRTLINLLGITSGDGHSFSEYGYIADASSSTGNHALATFGVNDIGEYDAFIGRYDSNSSFNTFFSFLTNPAWQQTNQGVIGSFLVRAPVPIPTSIWLFGSALIGFIGFNRKKTTQFF